MYKTLLEVSSEVRNKLLGQKRKRGQPKKLPACLTRSPQPQIPNSTYHSPSPNVSLNLTLSPTSDSSTPPQSQATRRSPQSNPIVSIIRNQKRSRGLEEFSDLPPAKRKSRAQKVNIVDNNIEKQITRSSKRINNKIQMFNLKSYYHFMFLLPLKRSYSLYKVEVEIRSSIDI